jgi:oligopeptide transport system permease protein
MSAVAQNTTSQSGAPKRADSNLWLDAIRRFRKNKLAVGASVILVILIITAIFANILAPYDYDYSDLTKANQFPGAEGYPLGTDSLGRDFLSRLIYGTRISLTVGFTVQLIAVVIGVTLGLLAGMIGGWVDYFIMRIIEVLTAVPIWLFALFMISVWRASEEFSNGGLTNVILAISLVSWVDICRLTRAQLLSLRTKEYVSAAVALGATPFQIALRHLLPNALAPLIVAVTLGIPSAIFTEAGLSFLGFGINDPLPSWGKMVAESEAYLKVYWHLGLFPTILIAITMLTFSFVGDGLRDALDPQLNK